jgi:hypothetical protein
MKQRQHLSLATARVNLSLREEKAARRAPQWFLTRKRRQKVAKPLTCCYETRRDTAAALRSRRRLLINCGVEANVSKTCSSSSLVFFPLRRDDSHSLE